MALKQAQIRQSAKAILEAEPSGLRWSEVLHRIRANSPDTPRNSIRGATFTLFRDDPEIVKVSRGFYRLQRFLKAEAVEAETLAEDEATVVEVISGDQTSVRLREADFYKAFADWLRDDLSEVTEAVALGGALFRTKWGTPDVIGVLKPQAADLIKFEPKIVSAEIKIDPAQPIIAFGQAVAYKLFSHKSYIVVPSAIADPDLDRLMALCSIYGIGLVTFELDVEEPAFTVRVTALPSQPDMTFVNEMARQFSEGARSQFNRLF